MSEFPDGELDAAVEIGAVDDRSVRIWLRQPHAAAVDVALRVEGRAALRGSLALGEDTDWTGALTLALSEAAAGARFACTVGEIERIGRLAPDPRSHARLVFGFGSCNLPFILDRKGAVQVGPAAGIYPAMTADLRRQQADFLFLAGDQIYSDELPPISIASGLGGKRGSVAPYVELLARYRWVTRGFLNQPGYRELRESLPVYCIWDDHDVINCWGSRWRDRPQQRSLFAAAARVYCEYQHQRNPGGRIGPPPYDYTFRYGDLGFLVLDLRGERDYENGVLLGEAQHRRVLQYLSGSAAETVQTMFVVASIPVAHGSRWLAKLGDRLPGAMADTVRDRWCSAAFVASRDELLGALLAWQGARPWRQAILLSGDVHCASAFTIRARHGKGRVRQFTSSAIANPNPLAQTVLNWIGVQLPNLFEPDFAFRRHLLAFSNNYGMVTADPLPGGGHRVTFAVRGWDRRQRRLGTVARFSTAPSDR